MFKYLSIILVHIVFIRSVTAQTLCMKSDVIDGRVERIQVILPKYKSKVGSIKFESNAEEFVIFRRSSKGQGKEHALPLSEVLTEFVVFKGGEISGTFQLTTAGSALGDLKYRDMRKPGSTQTFYGDPGC